MPARTGQQFLEGLKAAREIYVGDERVTEAEVLIFVIFAAAQFIE